MLVLTRKVGERIHIGEEIVITVVKLEYDRVRIGIDAPLEIAVHREEVHRRLDLMRGGPVAAAPAPDLAIRN